MREFSANISTILSTDDLSVFYLVSIENETYQLYHANTPYDITVAALGKTFLAENGLSSVEAPRLSSVVDREVYKIRYVDDAYEWRVLFEEGLQGAVVTVYIGFYNTTDININGVSPGKPFTDFDDLVVAYKGFVDTQGHSVDTSGEVIATIECASPMADLDLSRAYYTSKDSAHQRDSADTAYDDVYAGSKSVDLLWGKA